MRHAVFFDRWANEVMGLESGSFRARLREIEDRMLGPLALPLRRLAP